MSPFDIAAILFAFAACVGFANDRLLGLPRGIALLLGSVGASLVVLVVGHVTGNQSIVTAPEHRLESAGLPSVLLDGALALLLFAASLHVDLAGMKRNAWPVLGLATAGVVIATTIFTFGISLAFRISGFDVPLGWCFLLGAIIAPTDAVAVEGLLKQVPLPAGLRDIVSGESLFNDGTAVVIVLAALAVVSGQKDVLGHGGVLWSLIVESAGGVLVGATLGFLARSAIRRTDDENVALTASIALALGSYRLATHCGVSGPIAAVVAGLTLVNGVQGSGSPGWHQRVGRFWDYVDDVVNTLLFLLMGIQIFTLEISSSFVPVVLAAVPLALLARFISVLVPMSILPMHVPDRRKAVAALTWLGLRGAVSVALAMTIPGGPWKGPLETICYSVVVFTIVVQGLLTPRVLQVLYGKTGPAIELAPSP